MKEKFLPLFYCLHFKWITGQHLVWSVHTSFILAVQHCSYFYFMMCSLDDGVSTSTSPWAGKRHHGCPSTWWSRWSRCISVCFLPYKFEHFWAVQYFKQIPGWAVLRYMDILFIPGTLENAAFWTVWI